MEKKVDKQGKHWRPRPTKAEFGVWLGQLPGVACVWRRSTGSSVTV